MSQHKGLSGLRVAADSGILADLHVTPALKARLMNRLQVLDQLGRAEESAAEPEPEPQGRRLSSPWLARTVVVVAAAAVVLLAVRITLAPGGRVSTPAAQTQLPVPTPYSFPTPPPAAGGGVSNGLTIKSGGDYRTLTPNVIDAKGNAVNGSANSVSTSSTAARLVVTDSMAVIGNAQSFTASIADSYGTVSLSAAEAQPGRKIIINGEYGIRVDDAPAAIRRLHEIVVTTGGYVAEEVLDKSPDGAWNGRMTLRIPADRFAGAVLQLDGIGKLEHQRQWTQDVTDRYMDLEHRAQIMQEHEQRLRELATKAATFDDWNRLTTQINETRAQIENMTGQLKLLANQTEYALLYVQVVQPAPTAVNPETGAVTLAGRSAQALTNSLRQVGGLGAQAMVSLVGLAPFLLLLAIPAGLIVLAWRRRRAR